MPPYWTCGRPFALEAEENENEGNGHAKLNPKTKNSTFQPQHRLILTFSASAVDDLQMKELQDQLEAETYFSVIVKFITLSFIIIIITIIVIIIIINY